MTGRPPAPLVVVVDDDDAVRISLELFLVASGFRCRAFDSPETLLAAGVPDETACMVVDLRMPGGMDGVELIETLRRQGLSLPSLLVSGHGDITQAVRALRAGAREFIEKPYEVTALVAAIRAAIAHSLPGAGVDPAILDRVASLAERERAVLSALAEGLANTAIADRLGIGVRAVELHRSDLMRKLGARNLGEAVRIAVEAGLLD